MGNESFPAITYTNSERARIYTGATLGYLFDGYNLLLTTYLLPALRLYFKVGLAPASLLVTSALIGSVVGGILFGWMADIIGRRNTLFLTIITFAIFEVLTGLAPSLYIMYVTEFFVGLGAGGEWGVGFSLMNESWGNWRKGFAGGFLQSMFIFGSLFGTITAGYFISVYGTVGWRYAYIFVGLVSLVLLALRFTMPESKTWINLVKAKEGKEIKTTTPLRELFSKDVRRWTLAATLLAIGYFLFFYSGQSFYPSLFVSFGYAKEVTLIMITVSLVGIIGEWIIGLIVDTRLGRKGTSAVFGIYVLVFALVFLYATLYFTKPTPSYWNFAPFLALLPLYLIQAGYPTLFGVWFGELYPAKMRATGSNFNYMVGRGIGGGLAPILIPLAVSSLKVSLGVGMSIFMIIGIVIMLLGVLLLKETRGVDTTRF